MPFPYPVAPLILSHHERWDGKGYPAGLKGEEIPLGARILSVVDYFDALMAERPYHKAMSFEAAIGLLQQEAGQGARPDGRRQVHRAAAGAAGRGGEARAVDAQAGARRASRRIGQPATGLTPEPSKKNVFDDIALAHREIYALYEIAQAMGTSLGVSDTMALISAKLSNLVPFSCAALFLYDEETETLRCRFATGTDADIIQQVAVQVRRRADRLGGAQPPAARQRAAERRPRGRRPDDRRRTCSRRWSARCSSTSGSSARCRSITSTPAFYRDDHRRLLDRVSEQAAAVINNSMLFEQTQEDSLTDPLTGLPNTRFLFMHLTRELARAERLKSEVSLMVMDLDNFKEINDSHGHHVGDRALCEVARVLRAAIRPYDICVRYAGDEFIVVLSGCGADEAEQKRQELQQGVDAVYFEARPGKRAAARHQRRRGGVPARRRVVRGAARDRRQPDVPGQGEPQAAQRPHRLARPVSAAGRGSARRAHGHRHPARRERDRLARAGRGQPAAACRTATADSRPAAADSPSSGNIRTFCPPAIFRSSASGARRRPRASSGCRSAGVRSATRPARRRCSASADSRTACPTRLPRRPVRRPRTAIWSSC